MRAIQVTCPHCGARLNVGDGDVITCEYCGTASRVQRRTRMLERVLPPPPVDNQHPQQVAVQVRRKGHVGLILFLAFVLPTLMTGGIVWFAVSKATEESDRASAFANEQRRAMNAAFKKAGIDPAVASLPPDKRPPSWQAKDAALLADVNGDGTLDILGRGRQVNAGDVIRLIALDGKTGTFLWQSDVIGTYSETYRGPLALAGELLLFASDKGEVSAFATKTGERRWKISLSERVAYFCDGEDDASTVVAVTADNTLHRLERATGAAGATTQRGGRPRGRATNHLCSRLRDDDVTEYDRSKQSLASWELERKLDLSVDGYLESEGLRILAASRRTGTRVTLLVALDAKNGEKWRASAAAEALTAEGSPRNLAVGSGRACIIYYSNEYRVACFAVADGARVWDEVAPLTAKGLQIAGDALVITTARNIEVRELATGKVRWSMN